MHGTGLAVALASALMGAPAAVTAPGAPAAAAAPAGAAASTTTSTVADSARPAAAKPKVRWPLRATPGRMGPLRVGMTPKQARKTKLFRTADPICGRALELKRVPAKRIGADVFPMDEESLAQGLEWAWTTKKKWVRAKKNVRVGTRLKRLRRVFGDRLEEVGGEANNPHNAAYWFDVRGRRGALAFGFATEGSPGPRARVRVIAVTRSSGQDLYWGC